MKRIVLIILPFSLIGCSMINGVKVEQDGKNCFSKKELESLVSKDTSEVSHLFIEPIVVNNHACIGLYGYIFKNRTVTSRIIQKALRFEDKVYYYSSNNEKANETALKEFKDNHQSLFTIQEMEKLINSFNKGTEINARLY